MAILLDTSAVVVFLRRGRPARYEAAATAAGEALAGGRALLSAVSSAELLVGARDRRAVADLSSLLASVPVVAVDREVGALAGRMGALARQAGATIPLPDLLIAATAAWLDVPLLTCDSDHARGAALGTSPAGGPWSSLRLHAASG
ncbi:MAG TPA: PIN domain-containing protein [Longimicrobiales bacterium]|nr:PIN domain-containing protein [Longimicrobiales bacterium]